MPRTVRANATSTAIATDTLGVLAGRIAAAYAVMPSHSPESPRTSLGKAPCNTAAESCTATKMLKIHSAAGGMRVGRAVMLYSTLSGNGTKLWPPMPLYPTSWRSARAILLASDSGSVNFRRRAGHACGL